VRTAGTIPEWVRIVKCPPESVLAVQDAVISRVGDALLCASPPESSSLDFGIQHWWFRLAIPLTTPSSPRYPSHQ